MTSEHGTPEHQHEHRIDPERSACVLIGVDTYENLPSLRAVPRNLQDLERALADPDIWGLSPDRRWVVRNPDRPGDLTGPIREAQEKAEDTLLVYYAGHGLLELDDELHLTLPASQHGWRETSLAFSALRSVLAEAKSTVKRRVVILDCCYSGRALDEMDGEGTVPERQQIEIEGSYVLTSTTESRKAKAPLLKTYTAFTGALLGILNEGAHAHRGQELLTLNQIHRLLRDTLTAQHLPEPRCQDQNGVGDLPFIRNRQLPPPPRPEQSRWTRPRLAVAAAGMLLAGAGLGAGGLWGAQHAASQPDAFPGPCGGGRAELLDVSDRLDTHNEYQKTKIDGLSALALADGTSGALALRDAEAAQLFSLTLGTPTDLRPDVTHVQPLYDADGNDFEYFDGEGLVLERGGKTVLASSESGPAIRRFNLEDGRQVGKELDLPKTFATPSKVKEGLAEGSRSLESLAATPDGKRLFAGMEGALLGDDDISGSHQVRIQSYRGASGGDYRLGPQYGYLTDQGLYLSDLVAVSENRLLALERGYIEGLGNGIRVYTVDLSSANDITDKALDREHRDRIADKQPLFNLADCPSGDIQPIEAQPNPLLTNVEGMALGPALKGSGYEKYQGRRVLYLVSDNNARPVQSTRVYSLAVDLS